MRGLMAGVDGHGWRHGKGESGIRILRHLGKPDRSGVFITLCALVQLLGHLTPNQRVCVAGLMLVPARCLVG